MSIKDMKITPEQIQQKGVIASPDTLTGTADENKSVFDRLASEIIVPVVNAAIDEMSSMQEDADQWAADEEVRKANEIVRQANEEQRIANELARQEAESKRQNTFQQEVMQAEASAVRAEEEADRAKREADRAAAIAGGDFVTNAEKDVPGGVAGLDADGKVSLAAIPANGGSLLTVHFDETFAGLRYTIAGGAEVYQGVVPEGLTVRKNLLAAATKYDITVNLAFSEKRTSVMTQDYYTALQVTVAPFAATITVTCPAGSTVTCAKGDKLLSQIATEGTAVSTVDDASTWTITATLDGQIASGTVEITEEGQSKSIALAYVTPILNENSWETISKVSAENQGENYWSIGDCKEIEINGTVGIEEISGTFCVFIIGFNHNSELEGNGITFQGFKSSLSNGIDICFRTDREDIPVDGTKAFNIYHWGLETYSHNYGGWKGSDIRYDILGSTDKAPSGYGSVPKTNRVGYDASETTAINPIENTLMAALPNELRSVMKPMKIYTDNVGGAEYYNESISVSIDYLPLLAGHEIVTFSPDSNPYEKNYQKQYDYYAAGNPTIKYKHSDQRTAEPWWTRSPGVRNLTTEVCILPDGKQGDRTNSATFGLSTIFRI